MLGSGDTILSKPLSLISCNLRSNGGDKKQSNDEKNECIITDAIKCSEGKRMAS